MRTPKTLNHSKFGLGLVLSVGLLAGMGMGLAGCGNSMTNTASQVVMNGPPEGLATGKQTTVGVRPDVLGVSRELPLPATAEGIASSIADSSIAVSGTLHSVSADWIVLDNPATGLRHWISLDTVTWIRQATPKKVSGPSNAASSGPDGSTDDHGHSHDDGHDSGHDSHGDG